MERMDEDIQRFASCIYMSQGRPIPPYISLPAARATKLEPAWNIRCRGLHILVVELRETRGQHMPFISVIDEYISDQLQKGGAVDSAYVRIGRVLEVSLQVKNGWGPATSAAISRQLEGLDE